MLTCFLALRGVNLVQAAVCVATGSRSYRHPRLAKALAGAAAIESAWFAGQALRRAPSRELMAADAAFGAVGLVAMAAELPAGDRTASMNWMLPYTVVSAGGSLLALPRREGAVVAAVLGGIYSATVTSEIREGGASASAALANIVSYGGFFLAIDVFMRLLRGSADDVDEARTEAVERGQRLAVAAERNRQHRLLHDSALQTLEAVASGWTAGDAALRDRAGAEAIRLRRALSGIDDTDDDLAVALDKLAEEASQLGLSVEVVVAADLVLAPEVVAALRDAAREALVNVAKHAGVSRAVLRAAHSADGAEVIVRDHGSGFDPTLHHPGFGLSESVVARTAEIGGRATIWSAPGQGTRVTVRVPA